MLFDFVMVVVNKRAVCRVDWLQQFCFHFVFNPQQTIGFWTGYLWRFQNLVLSAATPSCEAVGKTSAIDCIISRISNPDSWVSRKHILSKSHMWSEWKKKRQWWRGMCPAFSSWKCPRWYEAWAVRRRAGFLKGKKDDKSKVEERLTQDLPLQTQPAKHPCNLIELSGQD